MTTSDNDLATVPEIKMEECINDIVEHFWDQLSGQDDEFIDEKIEDLAAHLGIDPEANDAIERYQEMYGRIIRICWAKLSSKLGEELGEVLLRDLEGDFA